MASICSWVFILGRMEQVLRFDFNGSSGEFKRTSQGFLRVKAHLTKTGIFSYERGREYRSEDEVFRTDSLESLKGAPVTDLHPSENGAENFLTSTNARDLIIGITESVERDGPYLKGSLLIFHEDAIKAIESGERKEISLGYKCQLDPTPGTWNGDAYDAVQKNIVVNHVAIGPRGWGRAGPDCAIKTDSSPPPQGIPVMSEVLRIDGVDLALTVDNVTTLLLEKRRQFEELKGRFDAQGLELEKEKAARAAAEDPQALESKVQTRLKLVEKCRRILGNETDVEGKTDEDLKLLGIKKFHPDLDLSGKDQSYIDGMFEAIASRNETRNDSLTNTRQAIYHNDRAKDNSGYERWIEQSAKMWTIPLTGNLQGGR
jgi:hypothetical protein